MEVQNLTGSSKQGDFVKFSRKLHDCSALF